jgi:hypothetical protein
MFPVLLERNCHKLLLDFGRSALRRGNATIQRYTTCDNSVSGMVLSLKHDLQKISLVH